MFGRMQEGEVVQGHHERRIGGARNEPGGMGYIDCAGGTLDLGPLGAQPCLVQPGRGQGQMRGGDGRNPRFFRKVAVTASHPDELHIAALFERGRHTDGGHGGATGHAMPALFEGVGDAHDPIVHPSSGVSGGMSPAQRC